MNQTTRANVPLGSKAALTEPKNNFRVTPDNGHQQIGTDGPLRAQ